MRENPRKPPSNLDPTPARLLPNEYVERSRRIHQNELENVPLFLAAGLLWVCTGPSVTVAAALFAAYVLSRFAHLYVLMTAGTHDARAVAWTIGSAVIYAMC